MSYVSPKPVARTTPGPFIVRGEIEAGSPGYAMGVEPATDDADAPRNCGWPYFIREDREFPMGSGPLWLAHGIQRKADADLFAAAPDMLAALRLAFAFIAQNSPGNPYLTEPGKSVAAAITLAEGAR